MIKSDGWGSGHSEKFGYGYSRGDLHCDTGGYGDGVGDGRGDGVGDGVGDGEGDADGDGYEFDIAYVTVLIINTDPLATVYQHHCMQTTGEIDDQN